MSRSDIQRYLEQLFRELGYSVLDRSPDNGEYGADLILVDGLGRRVAVLTQEWLSKSVGPDAVKHVEAAAQYYECDEALVVTTGKFSEAARATAQEASTSLWTLEELGDLMDQVRAHTAESDAAAAAVQRRATEADFATERAAERALLEAERAAVRAEQAERTANRAAERRAGPAAKRAAAKPAEWKPAPEPERSRPGFEGMGPEAGRRVQGRPTGPLEEEAAPPVPTGPRCPECGSPMNPRVAAGRNIWLCENFPRCRGAKVRE